MNFKKIIMGIALLMALPSRPYSGPKTRLSHRVSLTPTAEITHSENPMKEYAEKFAIILNTKNEGSIDWSSLVNLIFQCTAIIHSQAMDVRIQKESEQGQSDTKLDICRKMVEWMSPISHQINSMSAIIHKQENQEKKFFQYWPEFYGNLETKNLIHSTLGRRNEASSIGIAFLDWQRSIEKTMAMLTSDKDRGNVALDADSKAIINRLESDLMLDKQNQEQLSTALSYKNRIDNEEIKNISF